MEAEKLKQANYNIFMTQIINGGDIDSDDLSESELELYNEHEEAYDNQFDSIIEQIKLFNPEDHVVED